MLQNSDERRNATLREKYLLSENTGLPLIKQEKTEQSEIELNNIEPLPFTLMNNNKGISTAKGEEDSDFRDNQDHRE